MAGEELTVHWHSGTELKIFGLPISWETLSFHSDSESKEIPAGEKVCSVGSGPAAAEYGGAGSTALLPCSVSEMVMDMPSP